MININFRAPTPIWEQVRDNYRALILSGALPEGYKMPSVRELASTLAINPNTIQRAYRELEAEGYTVSVPGKGSFVCAAKEAAAMRRQELEQNFKALAAELKALGDDEAKLITLIKEAAANDD
ncbi:MAG: GntR family transcriptional regulator [Oscillospiraceae bacterium]|nr:GntR family transcriptional regulator [Oscillospiraceae bacterium]